MRTLRAKVDKNGQAEFCDSEIEIQSQSDLQKATFHNSKKQLSIQLEDAKNGKLLAYSQNLDLTADLLRLG